MYSVNSPLRRQVVTSAKPRKIEENNWESRSIGFKADIKFSFFFTASLSGVSERLTVSTTKAH